MEKENQLFKSLVPSVLIVVLMICAPIEAFAQSTNRAKLLENGTQVVMRVTEDFDGKNIADNGIINAIIEADVYSADGSTVLIAAGTPATLEYTAESNGSWGKAGKICITNAFTKTVDNKRVPLRLSFCKNGGSKIGGVIALSVLLFPIGLISGCMKGSMPKIQSGTPFNASVMQDIVVE